MHVINSRGRNTSLIIVRTHNLPGKVKQSETGGFFSKNAADTWIGRHLLRRNSDLFMYSQSFHGLMLVTLTGTAL